MSAPANEIDSLSVSSFSGGFPGFPAVTHSPGRLYSAPCSSAGRSSSGFLSPFGAASGSGLAQPVADHIASGGNSIPTFITAADPGLPSPMSSTMPRDNPFTATGASGGSGLAQSRGNPFTGRGFVSDGSSRSLSSPGMTNFPTSPVLNTSATFNANSFGLSCLTFSETLRPLDKFLSAIIEPLTPKVEMAKAFKFYNFEMPLFTLQDGLEPDIPRIQALLSLLLSVRQGRKDLAACENESLLELSTMCGIPLRDTSSRAVAACIALVTDFFLPSIRSVATNSDTVWNALQVKGLRAHLGILGFPIPVEISLKAELRGLIQKARAMIVYQGFLIPEMLAPFRSFSFPDAATFARTSFVFQATLVASVMDLESEPLPPQESFHQLLTSFGGLAADLSVFDASLWAELTDVFDRRVFLSMFLENLGVVFELTERLSSCDILPLLPATSLSAVPIYRPVYAAPTPPFIRKRRRIQEAIRVEARSASTGVPPAVRSSTHPPSVPENLPATQGGTLTTPTGLNPILSAILTRAPARLRISFDSTPLDLVHSPRDIMALA